MIIPPNTPAISIRQPYCHHILFDGKGVENRSWPTKFRGLVLIHASRTVDTGDRDLVRAKAMPLGGIVGVMTITDCVQKMASDWFFGPYGFVIAGAMPLGFVPCKGTISPKFFIPDIDYASLKAA